MVSFGGVVLMCFCFWWICSGICWVCSDLIALLLDLVTDVTGCYWTGVFLMLFNDIRHVEDWSVL